MGLLALGLAVPFLAGYGRFVAVRADVVNPTVATEEMSTGERSILIGAAVDVAASHPLVGTGLGTLPVAVRSARPGLTFDLQPAPIVILDVAAEVGLVGAACYGVVLVAPWLALWFGRRRWTPELVAASASLAALTLVGLFDYYTWTFAPGRIWAWLVIGLWAGVYSRSAASNVAA
jgi:predicted ferric reductase